MSDLSPHLASSTPDPEDLDLDAVRAIVRGFRDLPGAMLPVLHAVQDRLGWIPAAAVPLVAEGLNVSRAEVQGVLDFYHDFRRSPPGRHVIRICRAESCQARGSADIEFQARGSLGIGFGETTPDGVFTLLPVYCLGNCACSPAVRVDDEVLGRMNAQGLADLVRTLREEAQAQ